MKLNNNNVEFDEALHTYTYEERKLIGITGMINQMLFPEKLGSFAKIPKHILDNATKRGSDIHKQIEDFDNWGIRPSRNEVDNYADYKRVHNISTLVNEYIVTDKEHFATAIDMIDEDHNLYDFKTTYKLDEDYLSWQLTICAYMFELCNPKIKAGKLYGWWLREDTCKLVEVPRKSNDEVKDLMDAFINEKEFEPTTTIVIPEKDLVEIKNVVDEILRLEGLLKKYKKDKDRYLDGIRVLMTEGGLKSSEVAIGDSIIRHTLKLPYEKTGIDLDKLEKEYPDAFNACSKTTEVKGSMLLTIKKI